MSDSIEDFNNKYTNLKLEKVVKLYNVQSPEVKKYLENNVNILDYLVSGYIKIAKWCGKVGLNLNLENEKLWIMIDDHSDEKTAVKHWFQLLMRWYLGLPNEVTAKLKYRYVGNGQEAIEKLLVIYRDVFNLTMKIAKRRMQNGRFETGKFETN